ncbi:MAG TPA: cyclic nucleotide-binding domain-containing protein [Candidatus Polarisedimenticolia bacterium]|nr:cyclic nucleotide-binding domain-containing protein [Candidatus Polarisedimenticolia bacterium]
MMATPQAFRDYIVRFSEGERIYSTGDPGTEMYIVQSGAVEIFQDLSGKRVSLAVMEKGDFFGEMALIESTPHSSSAVALSDCEVIEINSTLFDKMIKGNIEIAVRMLRKLSIRLRDADRRIEQLAGQAGPPAQAEPPRETLVPSPMTLPAGRPTGVQAPSPSLPPGTVPKGCHAALLSEDGRELFHITTSRANIGRFDPVTGLKPEVDLSSLDLNRSVSRHHARLTFEGGVHSLTEEVGALNGTFINGKKLLSGKPSQLKTGDVLSLGMVKLVFQTVSG